MKRCLIFALICCLLLTGCSGAEKMQSRDLKKGIRAQEVAGSADLFDYAPGYLQLSASLLTKALELEPDQNILLCPLSIQLALAMTANGAQGETLAQLENLLGTPISQLNPQLLSYSNSLAQDEALAIANAIWFQDNRQGFQAKQSFLQTNANYYDCGLYAAPFNQDTLQEINSWVSDKTKGRIPGMLKELNPDAVIYLVNALSFDALWAQKADHVSQGVFTDHEGKAQNVEMLQFTEFRYLESDLFRGFSKPYEGGRYCFVGLLPQEGKTLQESAAALTGERLEALLASSRFETFTVKFPKFTADDGLCLNPILQGLGVTDAFDPSIADFSPMAELTQGTLSISQVLHKTHLVVDQHGTQAAAASSVEMTYAGYVEPPEMELCLDRPFLYMILDTQTNVPLFVGLMRTMP